MSSNQGRWRIPITNIHNVQYCSFPLTQIKESLISELSSVLKKKNITTDIYGHQSMRWTEYGGPTQCIHYSQIPTSDIVATFLAVDNFTVTQTDHAGIHFSQERSYTTKGMILQQTDARGNVTTTEFDIAGRSVKVTNPAGNVTAIRYSSYYDSPICITNALGDTICYSYDIRGRKTAEFGTATRPLCFAYDETDHMVTLTTFRTGEGDIATDPSDRTDGDSTTWLYDTATGFELKKTYADGSCTVKTYDRLNRLETVTKARGIITSYAYAQLTGELISVTHNDATPPWHFNYNHLGQIISITDASGIRELSYDAYGKMIQDTSFGTVENCLQENFDSFGRSSGYCLMLGTRTVQHSSLGYNHKGAITRMDLEELTSPFTWEYDNVSGFLKQLSYPNGLVRKNIYHPTLNLFSSINYEDLENGDMIAGHTYQYDELMRPIQRQNFWDATTSTTRNFTYNSRSELVNDQFLAGENFVYQYDNIGNRKISREQEGERYYNTNRLNQYITINREETSFIPSYDADGNQTHIKTSTGV